jgi:methylmalonyl-CoA mutase C-terminal domain/subunit
VSTSRALVRVVLVEIGGTEGTSLARTLRDEGVEVVYAGGLHTAEQVTRTVEQEDPDALGLAGDDPELATAIIAGVGEVPVFAVGTELRNPGVTAFATDAEAADWVARVAIHSRRSPT